MERYKIDFAANTITVTAAFHEKLQDVTSAEFKLMKELRASFPEMRIAAKTHRTPSRYRNCDGSTSYCNQFKNLTYQNMELFISQLSECEKFQAEYDFIKNYAGKVQRNGYTLVRRWFIAQFPEFRKNPLFYVYNTPTLVKASDIIQEEAEEKAAPKKGVA